MVASVPSRLRRHRNKNIIIVLYFPEAFIGVLFYAGCSSELWGIPPLPFGCLFSSSKCLFLCENKAAHVG